jgi:hypothetical protein
MHGKITKAILVAALLALPLNVQAAGTSAADFLNIDVSAYQASLGAAGAALSSEIASGYYNPAGLSMVERPGVNFMHNLWYQDISYEYLGSAIALGEKSVIGASAAYLHMGSIATYDASNQSGDALNPYSLAAIVSYSYNVNGKLTVGLSGKYISEKLADVEAKGYAFDIGAQYYHDLFTLGVVANNIGPKISYENDSYSLPSSVSFGASYSPYQLPISVLAGARVPFDGKTSFSFGAEYKFAGFMSIRSGIGGLGSDHASSAANFGAGFNLGGIDVDYAFNPGGDLGATHFFSFTMGIGDTRKVAFDRQQDVPTDLEPSVKIHKVTDTPATPIADAPKPKQAKTMYVVSAGYYNDERVAKMHAETLENFDVKGTPEAMADGGYRVVLIRTDNPEKAEKAYHNYQNKGINVDLSTE